MKKIFPIILVFFIISCISMPQRLSSIQPKAEYEELGKGPCKACSFLLFGAIPIAWRNFPARAYLCAIQSRGGDNLINPVIQESWYYAVVGNVRCIEVSGIVDPSISEIWYYAYIGNVYCTTVSETVVKEKNRSQKSHPV